MFNTIIRFSLILLSLSQMSVVLAYTHQQPGSYQCPFLAFINEGKKTMPPHAGTVFSLRPVDINCNSIEVNVTCTFTTGKYTNVTFIFYDQDYIPLGGPNSGDTITQGTAYISGLIFIDQEYNGSYLEFHNNSDVYVGVSCYNSY